MNTLPLNQILEIDQPIFGANLFNLSKLIRENVPVIPGIAVSPPEIILQTILKHTEQKSHEVFEQKLDIIKNELAKIPIPNELDTVIRKIKNFYLNGNFIKSKETLWKSLLLIYLNEIRSRIWREGFNDKLISNLSAQPIFFLDKNLSKAKAYFDPDLSEVVISSPEKIDPQILKKIDEIVMLSNKKLVLPQIYSFVILSKKPYIIGLTPFTQSLPLSKTADIILPKNEQKKICRLS